MTRRLLISACVAILAGLGAPAPAAAQGGSLPPQVVEAATIGPEEGRQIDAYIDDAITRMASDNPQVSRGGRDDLLAPLRSPRISVAFRQSYGAKLTPKLAPMVEGKDDRLAINALRVMGEVASPETAAALETAVGDSRLAVKYAAQVGIGRTFAAMTEHHPAIPAGQGERLVARLGEAVAQEQHRDTLDAALRSIIAAQRIGHGTHASVREAALRTLAERAGERLKKMEAFDDALIGMLRALSGIREALTVADPALQPSSEGVRKAAEVAGHAIAYIARHIEPFKEAFKESPSETHKALLNEAETILVAAGQKAGGQYTPLRLGDEFAGTNAGRVFFQRALEAIKWLQGPPFRFPEGTIIRGDGGANGGR